MLIVEDFAMFREALRIRLNEEPDIEVVGAAASGEEALGLIEQAVPDILVTDARLPRISGFDYLRCLKRRWPTLKVLVLTSYDFDEYVPALARLGIQGYLVKTTGQDVLVRALKEIASGRMLLPYGASGGPT